MDKLKVDDQGYNQEIKYKSQDLVKYERKMADADKETNRIINQC